MIGLNIARPLIDKCMCAGCTWLLDGTHHPSLPSTMAAVYAHVLACVGCPARPRFSLAVPTSAVTLAGIYPLLPFVHKLPGWLARDRVLLYVYC